MDARVKPAHDAVCYCIICAAMTQYLNVTRKPRRRSSPEQIVQHRADVVVLGAGMVGVSAALHLQQRGRDVILLDRHARAGEETSYGNAGLIEQASVFPYMFPRNFGQILRTALDLSPAVLYATADLPQLL